jgi:hypothetical protein
MERTDEGLEMIENSAVPVKVVEAIEALRGANPEILGIYFLVAGLASMIGTVQTLTSMLPSFLPPLILIQTGTAMSLIR